MAAAWAEWITKKNLSRADNCEGTGFGWSLFYSLWNTPRGLCICHQETRVWEEIFGKEIYTRILLVRLARGTTRKGSSFFEGEYQRLKPRGSLRCNNLRLRLGNNADSMGQRNCGDLKCSELSSDTGLQTAFLASAQYEVEQDAVLQGANRGCEKISDPLLRGRGFGAHSAGRTSSTAPHHEGLSRPVDRGYIDFYLAASARELVTSCVGCGSAVHYPAFTKRALKLADCECSCRVTGISQLVSLLRAIRGRSLLRAARSVINLRTTIGVLA